MEVRTTRYPWVNPNANSSAVTHFDAKPSMQDINNLKYSFVHEGVARNKTYFKPTDTRTILVNHNGGPRILWLG